MPSTKSRFSRRALALALNPPSADYPYPLNAKGNPIDTPEWRDANDITAHAPTPQEKVKVDNALFKAIREYEDAGMGPIDEALGSGIDINCVDKFGFTPLHLAIKNKNLPLVNKFLEVEGVDLNAKTKKGFAPIHVAAWKGELNTVQKLITKGCDINAKDTAGRNVWGVAHDWHHEEVRSLAASLAFESSSSLFSPRMHPLFLSCHFLSDPRAAQAQRLPLQGGRHARLPARAQVAPGAPRQDVGGRLLWGG